MIILFVPILFLTSCGKKTDEITVISREDGSGTRGVFSEVFGLIEKSQEGEVHDTTYREAVVTSKTDIVLTNVEGDVNAIGYVSAGTLSERVKEVAIDGVMPTAENIRDGIYPAARSFNLAVLPEKREKFDDFISFILSREGQKTVSQSYVSLQASESYSGNFSGKITVAGSSSVTPLMERLSEEYMKLNPNADIEIQMSDSSSGISGAAEGICDIGMSSRELTRNELKTLESIKIASDGIAVVVNRKNPVDNISSEDIRKIYRGETVNWSFLK